MTQPPTTMPATHPIADLFPLMTNEEYRELKADIQEHGQFEPCTLHSGVLLDGRNRWHACDELGKTPLTIEWSGEAKDIPAFIISKNLQRRHLTISQQAMIAERLRIYFKEDADTAKKAGRKQANHKYSGNEEVLSVPGTDNTTTEPKKRSHEAETARKAAALTGVSTSAIYRAAKVNADPKLAAEVLAGTKSLKAASAELSARAKGPAKKAHPRPISLTPQKPRGYDGKLSPHTHEFHADCLALGDDVVQAIDRWVPNAQQRFIAEIEDIATITHKWAQLLRDSRAAVNEAERLTQPPE